MEARRWFTDTASAAQWREAVDDLLWTASGLRLNRQLDEHTPPVEIRMWQAGPFALQTGRTEARVSVSRTREAVHATTDDHYWLFQSLGPEVRHSFPQKQISARSGELLLGTADTVFEADGAHGFDNRVVFIPRPMLDCFLKTPDFKDALAIDIQASALVRSCLDALWSTLPAMDEATAEANLHAIMALLAVAVGASSGGLDAGRQAYRAALVARAQRFIDASYGDVAVTPAGVAAALKISLRQLHRLFESTGQSVAERIAVARLEQSARLLTDPAFAEIRVADIAYRSGFDSLATFHRLFKSHFGCSPGELREAGRRQGGEPITLSD